MIYENVNYNDKVLELSYYLSVFMIIKIQAHSLKFSNTDQYQNIQPSIQLSGWPVICYILLA